MAMELICRTKADKIRMKKAIEGMADRVIYHKSTMHFWLNGKEFIAQPSTKKVRNDGVMIYGK